MGFHFPLAPGFPRLALETSLTAQGAADIAAAIATHAASGKLRGVKQALDPSIEYGGSG